MAAIAVEREHRVTLRELFFDLVFVFAFTQVAVLVRWREARAESRSVLAS